MRNSLIILLLLFTLTGMAQPKPQKKVELPAKKYQSQLERNKLKGKVKSIIDSAFTTKMVNGEIVKDTLLWYHDEDYDVRGNMVKQIKYKWNGSIQTNFSGYDMFEDNGSLGMVGTSAEKYSYNTKGYIISGIDVKMPNWKDSIVYYDNGVINKEISFHGGTKGVCTIYQCDDKWNLSGIERISPAGELIAKDTMSYDQSGFLVDTHIEYHDGWNFTQVNKYDFRQDMVEEDKNYKIDSNSTITINRYDDKKHLTEAITHKKNGRLESNYSYNYDNQGNRIAWSSFDKLGKLLWKKTYSYENYDVTGNWTKLTINSGGKLKIITRHFEYYK